MSARGSSRTCNSKPVNINISFTINPKNILNKQSESSENGFKMKKGLISEVQTMQMERQILQYKTKTPDLPSTDRVQYEKEYCDEDKKQKPTKKRNLIDQSFLNGLNKKNESINLQKFQQSFHFRKTSLKSKKHSETVVKRKHNKAASKHSTGDNPTLKNTIVQSVSNDQRTNYKKNLKNMINSIMKSQLSKRSLPLVMPTQQLKTARKKKLGNKKELKTGRSEYFMSKKSNEEDKVCIEKFASIRSMNNSIFKSEQDEQLRPRSRRTIIINTDQSIDCINQIHEMEKAIKKFYNIGSDKLNEDIEANYQDTKNLIENYIGNLRNESEQKQDQVLNKLPKKIFLQSFYDKSATQKQSQEKHQITQSLQFDEEEEKSLTVPHQLQKNSDFRPFCSSQMTKEQKMISEIERVKLTQLKKHEVQKWGQLLTFIKKSMNEGKVNHDQILIDIYQFLEQTKMDLQKEINKPQKQQDDLDEFTNKFSSNQLKPNEEKFEVRFEASKSISSMKYEDEDNGSQNEQLKLMNLEMIENALKARHDNLMDKMARDIANLEEQRNNGKISEEEFEKQKQRLDKWTKRQTGQIMQARKNIWKGYNEAKGIIEKSLKSRYFQQESAKKKSMMKCLSQDYLLKSYKHKKLIQPQDPNHQSSESSEYDYDYANDLIQQKRQSLHKPLHCSSQNQEASIQEQHSQKLSAQNYNENDNENEVSAQGLDENEFEQDDLLPSSNQKAQESQEFQPGLVIENKRKKCLNNEQSDQKLIQQQKQFHQLKQLTKQNDINLLKQKLQDIKQRHFNSDHEESYESGSISYEEVDKDLQERSVSSDQMRLISHQLNKDKVSPGLAKSELQKLKDIVPEDKEDIFEFIFLDLSIELYQEPCHGNKIMNCINQHVQNTKRQANKKKGIKTNLNVVKQYLKRFIGFITRAHKNVLNTLDQPVGPSALEMLRYMHDSDDQVEGQEEPMSPLIIPSYVFDLFENSFLSSIEFETYYENDDDRENRRIEFLRNVLHIHNKAIFDAMNEYLDLLRPYGLWGKPFPWKSSSTFQHPTSDQQKQEKLKKTNEKIIQYCSYVCGLLVDKQESLVGNVKLSQDYIHQIKQDRLSRMLATELMENEQRWLFYDDEETQVLVEISTFIHIMLAKEAQEDITKILLCR